MESNKLKQKLEMMTCHIHGDAANVSVAEGNVVEIETCCLLFRQQLLLMADKHENLVSISASNA